MRAIWSILAVTLFLNGLSGSAQAAPQSSEPSTDDNVVHLLNRVTFGPRPGDIERVKEMGIDAYLSEQLSPASISESSKVKAIRAELPDARANTIALIQQFRDLKKIKKEEKKSNKGGDNNTQVASGVVTEVNQGAAAGAGTQINPDFIKVGQFYKKMNNDLINLKLTRDLDSPRQLNEVMTEFWFNHFNVCQSKGLDRVLVEPFEDQAIRPNALGKFRDLVSATAYHPAMLYYLDNWQNSAPGNANAKGKQKGINENYARELMELHTLGVDGGYSQKDVQELARILTGLGIAGPNNRRQNLVTVGPFGAAFDPNRHDFTDKNLLGTKIVGSGTPEIQQAIDILVRQPATAHHIAFQLAQYFVADDPPKSLVTKLQNRFSQSDGDIKATLTELFHSSEFWDPQYRNNKYKTPLRYAISVLRASDAHPDNMLLIGQFLQKQGQPLYGCLTPDGYKNTKDAWLNPDSLINRINFATAIGTGNMKQVIAQAPEYRQLGATISDSKFSNHTVDVVMKAPPQLKSAVVLGSPEFMHY